MSVILKCYLNIGSSVSILKTIERNDWYVCLVEYVFLPKFMSFWSFHDTHFWELFICSSPSLFLGKCPESSD